MLFSHVKISCLRWYFIGVYIIKRKLFSLWIRNTVVSVRCRIQYSPYKSDLITITFALLESLNRAFLLLLLINQLEEFSAVFTNLGASGRFGPTTLVSHYAGQDHDGQVTLSSGIQHWTVPYTGDYRIEAVGAAGGYDRYSTPGQFQGRGARIIGTFSLSRGEIIQILVGQEGGINKISQSAGGGGGTFVVRGSNTPLIIAGGGGGIENSRIRHAGCDASTNKTGNPGHKSWSGGSNGYGAQTADSSNSGEEGVFIY